MPTAILTLLAYLVFYLIMVCCTIITCGADKNREKVHVERRQELKSMQRDAVLSGRPVQTVIEEVEPHMIRSTSRLSCVRDMPDMASMEKVQRARKKRLQNVPKLDYTPIKSMECAQGLAADLSELHDIVGKSKSASVMNCPGLSEDILTAILMDEENQDGFYDVPL